MIKDVKLGILTNRIEIQRLEDMLRELYRKIDNLVLSVDALQTLGASDSISINGTVLEVKGDGGAKTLTSTPSIVNGVSGQVIIVVGVDATNKITLQDDGTLPDSGLRLGANTRELGEGDSLGLMYSGTLSDWVELFFNNVL